MALAGTGRKAQIDGGAVHARAVRASAPPKRGHAVEETGQASEGDVEEASESVRPLAKGYQSLETALKRAGVGSS